MNAVATAIEKVPHKRTVMGELATRYSMEPDKLLATLKQTCIKGNATNEQVQAFCIVANRYGLDPFLKEIHAFPDKSGGIVPIVGIDGWTRIVNRDPNCDGVEFEYTDDESGSPHACACIIYIKGRTHPVRVTEYYEECKRNTQPWTQYPRRMLRHKAFMQAARLAFGLAGIYDEDEARDILANEAAGMPQVKQATSLGAAVKRIAAKSEPVNQPEQVEGEIVPPDQQDAGPQSIQINIPCDSWEVFADGLTEASIDHVTPDESAAVVAKIKLTKASTPTQSGKQLREQIARAVAAGQFNWKTGEVMN